jgi:hypothetical protein
MACSKIADPAAAESVTVSQDIFETQNRYNNNNPSSFKIYAGHINTYDISWGDITAINFLKNLWKAPMQTDLQANSNSVLIVEVRIMFRQ